jgi:hypothetical protein
MKEGAYNTKLEELSLSQGLCRAEKGELIGAARSFRMSQHISRVNHGLYTPAQIKALTEEISVWIQLEDLEMADGRRKWLHLVRINNVEGDALVDEVHEYSSWLRTSAYLELPDAGFQRLQTSLSILMPLLDEHPKLNFDILWTLYHIKAYDPTKDVDSDSGAHLTAGYQSFVMTKNRVYKLGKEAMLRVLELPLSDKARGETLAHLADWMLWNSKVQTAQATYMEAHALNPDATTPRPIPGVEVIPHPEGNTLVSFNVTATGKLSDLEYPEGEFMLARKTKGWRYRPLIKDGEFTPVRVELKL